MNSAYGHLQERSQLNETSEEKIIARLSRARCKLFLPDGPSHGSRAQSVNALFSRLPLAFAQTTRFTMSKASSRKPAHAPDLVRCEMCWGWIDRGDTRSQFEHRGPLPHPRELKGRPEVFDDENDLPG